MLLGIGLSIWLLNIYLFSPPSLQTNVQTLLGVDQDVDFP